MYYRKLTGFKARNDDKSQIILSNIDFEVERGIREASAEREREKSGYPYPSCCDTYATAAVL